MLKPLPLLLMTLLPLTSCTAWYKPGADEEELAIEQQRCEHETQTSSGEKFIACMERAGWHHTAFSASVTEPDIRSSNGPEEGVKAKQVESKTQLGVDTGRVEGTKAQCRGTIDNDKTTDNCAGDKIFRPSRIRISIEEPDTDD